MNEKLYILLKRFNDPKYYPHKDTAKNLEELVEKAYYAGRNEAIKEIMDIQEIEYQKANDDNFRGGIAHVINIIKKKKLDI